MKCDCDGWKKCYDKLNNAVVMAQIRKSVNWDMQPWICCPWCGNR